MGKPIKILLLTNRDSQNVGDLIIEGTDVSLIKLVFQNLGYAPDEISINSRAGGIIPKEWVDGKSQALGDAEDVIKNSDIVIFGGAPILNYKYQFFYIRTIKVIEICEKYNKSVLFSAIGVEEYDDTAKECQMLKKALNKPIVKMITTRDDIDSVKKYIDNPDTIIGKVADPAVWTDKIYGKMAERQKKCIGLLPVRIAIFKDNKLRWNEKKQMHFWKNVIDRLKKDGYTYKLFTSGHFTDEYFLMDFANKYNIPKENYNLSVHVPEQLVEEINKCDGLISFRMHPSIIAYSYGIPSIGLAWNFKVQKFYEAVNYDNRSIPKEKWDAEYVTEELYKAMNEGVKKEEEFLMTIYDSLYNTIKSLYPSKKEIAFNSNHFPQFEPTTINRYGEILNNKTKRIMIDRGRFIVRSLRKIERFFKEIVSFIKNVKKELRRR